MIIVFDCIAILCTGSDKNKTTFSIGQGVPQIAKWRNWQFVRTTLQKIALFQYFIAVQTI